MGAPGIAVGLWMFVAVIVGTAYPAFIQRFRVEPAESVRAAPFIERNIAATRTALGLANVTVRPFAYDEQLSVEALQKNSDTIRNVRLWDPQVQRQTYQRLQEGAYLLPVQQTSTSTGTARPGAARRRCSPPGS